MTKKLFLSLGGVISFATAAFSAACGVQSKDLASQIESEISHQTHSDFKMQFDNSKSISLEELKRKLSDLNLSENEYRDLVWNNSELILKNLHDFSLKVEHFFLYKNANDEILNSKLYKHQLGLIQASELDDPSQTYKHKHYQFVKKSIKINFKKINQIKMFDSQENQYQKVIFLYSRSIAFKMVMQNNFWYLLPEVYIFLDNTVSEMNLEDLNKYFNYNQINEQLINEYETSYVNEYGPASVARLVNSN
ncbi:hypothetical protein [Mycoplasma buteonis]|uniref:hypothetical protein n=1 Tax=Mycoplasma buteonis TaxID=171280 RepID=UPI000562BBD4|nr:hypothetical protein [Mycoplasma buteonis]